MFFWVSAAWGTQISPDSARKVAQGQIQHHIAVFGHWNGADVPVVTQDHEMIALDDGKSAYYFPVQPGGYVIVAANEHLSPVPFYSTRSAFDIKRADNPNSLEALIVSRLNIKAQAAADFQVQRAAANIANVSPNASRIQRAWTYFGRLGNRSADDHTNLRSASRHTDDIIRGATVGPLLTTVWGQNNPYNLGTPDDDCDNGHTLTGCVATAWAQVLKYWQWPPKSMGGQNELTYTWEGDNVTQDFSVDFSNSEAYDWDAMPDDLASPNTTESQKNAVSKLMHYLGVSAETIFRCPDSSTGSSSNIWAYEVLDTYFRYKSLNQESNWLSLKNYSAAEWFSIIKNELDQDPPRPVIFSIGTPGSSGAWHEVVIDGYQDDVANKVHINFGWDGNYDAYYDISDDDNFDTPGFNWDVKENQVIVIGIEPDNTPPQVEAGADTSAEEETEVTLSVVSASDPENVGVSHYEWVQVSGPNAVIANSSGSEPTITTPNVHGQSDLVFQVKAYDVNRAFGTDNCTVTVRNTDGSKAPAPPSSGGGGGCFLNDLMD